MRKPLILLIILFVIVPSISSAQHKEMINESLKIGISLFQKGEYLEALVEFEIVLELDPRNAQALKYKRLCEEKLGPERDQIQDKAMEKPRKAAGRDLFTNEANTLLFSIPNGYQYKKSGTEDAFLKGDCRIALSHYIKMTDVTTAKDEILVFFRKRFSPVSLIEERKKPFGEREGYEIQMTASFSGQENTVLIGIIHLGRVGYLLYGMSPSDRFSSCSDDYKTTLASLSPQKGFPDFSLWTRKEGRYASIHAFPKSYASQNMEGLLHEFDRATNKISTVLGIQMKEKIKLFLYPDKKTLHKVTLRDSGFAITEAGEAHLEWFSPKEHQSLGHEITHVITYKGWGEPGEALFGEGIAVYLDLTDQDLFKICSQLKKEGRLLPLSSLLGERWFKNDPLVSYKQSGAFVRFLIERFGIGKFSAIYPSKSLGNDLKKIYGKTIAEMEDLFISSLQVLDK